MKKLFAIIFVLVAVCSSYGNPGSGVTETTGTGITSTPEFRALVKAVDYDIDIPEAAPSSSAGQQDLIVLESTTEPEPAAALASAATPKEPVQSPQAQPPQPDTKPESKPEPKPEASQTPASEPQQSTAKPNTTVSQSVPEPPPEPPVVNCPAPQPVPDPQPQPDLAPAPEPAQPASIYDYPFDIEAIRAELITLGQCAGIAHVTTDDGHTLTPDNASWGNPIAATRNFQGENLRRRLHDLVSSMPTIITSFGGNPIAQFTIYIEPQGDGAYTIYYLY